MNSTYLNTHSLEGSGLQKVHRDKDQVTLARNTEFVDDNIRDLLGSAKDIIVTADSEVMIKLEQEFKQQRVGTCDDERLDTQDIDQSGIELTDTFTRSQLRALSEAEYI
jgi:hypothetical protein